MLIEPKTETITPNQFLTLKNQKLDALILSEPNTRVGVSESSDSTMKKLIY